MKPKAKESYDKYFEKYKRTYFLDRDACYLSVFLNKQKYWNASALTLKKQTTTIIKSKPISYLNYATICNAKTMKSTL